MTSIAIVLFAIVSVFIAKQKNSPLKGVNMPECQSIFVPRGVNIAGMAYKFALSGGSISPE
jgi:hypothetical protein